MSTRTEAECRIRWLEHDQPGLARDRAWTGDEVDKLLELANKYDKANWAQISWELGTGRTAADCVRQYRNTTFTQHDFSPADDQRLMDLIAEHAMDWQKSKSHVAASAVYILTADVIFLFLLPLLVAVGRLMGLAASQVSYRYTHSLIPTKTKGQFSEKEDSLLRAAVTAFGTKSWTKVATQVPGRTGSQCRDRWRDYLDPDLRPARQWEEEEEKLIVRMKEEEGKGWDEIASALGEGRSALQVSGSAVVQEQGGE